jgi:hypothetical protein
VIQVNSRWLALVPFGVGQFQNRQMALGWTFLATESLLVAGSVISQLVTIYNVNQMNGAIESGSSTAGGYHARAQDAYIATDLFTAGFALVAIAGIIHAEATFVPERVEVRARPLPPLSLSPLIAPLFGRSEGGAGAILGVGGTF